MCVNVCLMARVLLFTGRPKKSLVLITPNGVLINDVVALKLSFDVLLG